MFILLTYKKDPNLKQYPKSSKTKLHGDILVFFRSFLKNFSKYSEISGVNEILRRYFVMNAFDGALTMLGIIMGAYLAGVIDPMIIIKAGMGAGLAMGISGAWGAYMAERAERSRNMKELENAIFSNLEGTMIDKASKAAVVSVALVDGVSPLIATFISILPFFLAVYYNISIFVAIALSIVIIMCMLFLLGVFLSKVAGGRIIINGAIMVLAGIVTLFLCLFLII
jgi:predicted membrane protein (TIGR00267 family)